MTGNGVVGIVATAGLGDRENTFFAAFAAATGNNGKQFDVNNANDQTEMRK